MNLNNIQLKASVVADLYKDVLIGSEKAVTPSAEPIKYLGNNRKNILVIVSYTDVPYLPDEDLLFLTNILAACKLSAADIGIINHHQVDRKELQNMILSEAAVVLLFGVEPLAIDLPINFPTFQLQKFAGKTYLHAPTLQHLERDKTAKQKLWNSLKQLFQL